MAVGHRALIGRVRLGGLALRLLVGAQPLARAVSRARRRGRASPSTAGRGRRLAAAVSDGAAAASGTRGAGGSTGRGAFGGGSSSAPPAGGYGFPWFTPETGIDIAGFFAGASTGGA